MVQSILVVVSNKAYYALLKKYLQLLMGDIYGCGLVKSRVIWDNMTMLLLIYKCGIEHLYLVLYLSGVA